MASEDKKQVLRLVVSKKAVARCSDEDDEQSLISRLSESNIVQTAKRSANDASYVAKKLIKSVGRSTWLFCTTIFIVFLPLIVVTEQEQLFIEYENQLAVLAS